MLGLKYMKYFVAVKVVGFMGLCMDCRDVARLRIWVSCMFFLVQSWILKYYIPIGGS